MLSFSLSLPRMLPLSLSRLLGRVSMSGAQLCSIEDVRITGASFTAGIVGLPGSGGYSANIRVTGGRFAVWQQSYRPNPSIAGLVALNQSVSAVLVEIARGPVIISGFVVRTSLATASVSDNSVTPLLPRICSTTLTDCFAPHPLRRGDEATHQRPRGAVACLLPAASADVSVRSADDVIAFEGRRRGDGNKHKRRRWRVVT